MPVDQYLIAIIEPLLKHKESLVVTAQQDQMGILLTVVCHKDDMGAVIGKQGDTAKCIRHLVRICGIKQNARVSVKINEPDGSPYRPRDEAQSDRELIV